MSSPIPTPVGVLRIGLAGSGPKGAYEDVNAPRDPVISRRLPRRLATRSRRGFVGASVLLAVPLGTVLLSSALGLVAMAILRSYLAHLDGQAVARLRPLPGSLRDQWQPFYPGVDLARVRYAEGIDTVHGKGITVGLRIYFPCKLDLDAPADRHWMAHELQHCSQYGASGRVGAFLRTYFAQVARQVIASRSFDVHDHLGLEIEAETQAVRVAPVLPPMAARLNMTGLGRPGPVETLLVPAKPGIAPRGPMSDNCRPVVIGCRGPEVQFCAGDSTDKRAGLTGCCGSSWRVPGRQVDGSDDDGRATAMAR